MAKSVSAGKRATSRAACCGPECCGTTSTCCGLPSPGGCRVDAVVSVDHRGQMVLPKEVREQFGIHAEDKLAVVSWSREDKPCCLTLLKVDELADTIRQTYGPVLREIVAT
jgi:antitoxin PrlF